MAPGPAPVMSGSDTRLRLEIQGAVQGVGFRPFIYRLATEAGLTGWVLNGAAGVVIEADGSRAQLEAFRARVAAEHPPTARITRLATTWLAPAGFQAFQIAHSDGAGARSVQVLPDLATCPACLGELRDPSDRRYGYPFVNCTTCGPRFTIITALPYDRPNTTMAGFALCPACRTEYERPDDRRFHAQPNACPVCGPALALWQMDEAVSSPIASGAAALTGAIDALRAGQIVAVKGLGGFHLVCDARNEASVCLLRERKARPRKPFALMVRDLTMAAELCELPHSAADLLTAPEAPILLLQRRDNVAESAASVLVAPSVAPGMPTLGLMLPSTPLHHLLLDALGCAMVATSGNRSDEPICTDDAEALSRLAGIADLLLGHNRPIARHADDSVAFVLREQPRLLRRARGYAPAPVLLRRPIPCILGVGAQLKSAVALSVGQQVFLSQHIGDLATPEARMAFSSVVADLLRLYEAKPVVVAHDLHPDYVSTHFARELATACVPIQHHHAHFAACLAEHQVEHAALGVIWDGTGYGHDGTIWGGEWLYGTVGDSRRVAHLLPFALVGGEAAVREPRRVALALLAATIGAETWEATDLEPVRSFSANERSLLRQMLTQGLNSIATTSAGRLFDGVAALLGLCQRASFEGEAAIMLEHAADPNERGSYPFELADDCIDWRPTVAALLSELRRGVAVGLLSARFHTTMVAALVAVAQRFDPPAVALSGGCFQNRLLTERAAAALEATGRRVLLHRLVPPNDGGICLGQVAAAAARLRE